MRFKHDCNACVFVKCIDNFDLYYCDNAGYRTYLARYGNSSEEYCSVPEFVIKNIREQKFKVETDELKACIECFDVVNSKK